MIYEIYLVVLLDDSEELAEVGRDRLDERVVLVCVIFLRSLGVGFRIQIQVWSWGFGCRVQYLVFRGFALQGK